MKKRCAQCYLVEAKRLILMVTLSLIASVFFHCPWPTPNSSLFKSIAAFICAWDEPWSSVSISRLNGSAGKFAAKEAIIKAMKKKIKLNEIEIKNKRNELEIIIKNKIEPSILISISHEKDYAIAMSVIETVIKNRF